MKFLFFIILLSAIGGGGGYFYMQANSKISSLILDNHLLKNELKKLKEQYEALVSNSKNCRLEFIDLAYKCGEIKKDSSIYLSPRETSCILNKSSDNMQVEIIEKAIVNNNYVWYFIALPIESNINSKGWVKEADLNELEEPQTEEPEI